MAAGELEIAVFGGAIGECIVLGLPNGRWGVVDSYSSKIDRAETHGAITYLKERGVSELEFVCLTHPHHDHYRGMSLLLTLFHVHQFWRFGATCPERLIDMINLADEDATNVYGQEIPHSQELCGIFEIVQDLRERGILKTTALSDIKPAYTAEIGGVKLTVASVAPSTDLVEAYESDLSKCFDKEGVILPKRPQLDHNRISVALVVTFGATSVVLGGDVEHDGWKAAVEACHQHGVPLAAHAVKVSHHGSTNGYCDNLWAQFCEKEFCLAVVTPFVIHGLPSAGGIDHIKRHTSDVIVTSSNQDSKFDFWDDYSPQLQGALRSIAVKFLAARGAACSIRFDDEGHALDVRVFKTAA